MRIPSLLFSGEMEALGRGGVDPDWIVKFSRQTKARAYVMQGTQSGHCL